MDLQSLPWYGQLGVFLFIGLIFVGIFYFSYYSPEATRLENIEIELEKVEDEIRKAERKQSKMAQIQEELENKKQVLEKLKAILPEKKEISQILKKIQSIISNARLDIIRFTVMQEKPQSVYVEAPIAITLEGNYHNLGIFFDQLSKLQKIFTVNNLSIRPFNKMTAEHTVNVSFNATTYLYREAPPPKPRRRRR
jgi:type IV pilus assembly protein PilO